MKKKLILTALMGVVLSHSLAAQERRWTLQQCVEYAIENNLTIQKNEVSTELNKVEVNTAKWARLPNLNGGVDQNFGWGRDISPDDNSYTTVSNKSTNFSLSTSVPLFTGMRIPNQYALAKLNLKASIEDLNKAKDDIAINVASLYVQALFNKEIAKVAVEQVKLSNEQLNRMVRLKEVGKASSAQVAEMRARVAQDEMSAVEANNNHDLSLLNLSQLLELPTPAGFALAEPEVEPEFLSLTPPDDIFMYAVADKPEIKAAQYRVEGSQKNIRIALSNYYPSLSFGGGISTNYYTPNRYEGVSFWGQLDKNLSRSIRFSLSVPLFNRFETRNRVRTARLQQKNYSIALEESKKTLYKEIQQAWYNALAAETKYKTSKVAVEANEESFQLMGEKFENGKATILEFNEAKMNLMKALSDRIQAKYEYMFRSKILDFYKGRPIQ